VGAPIVKPIKP